MNDEKQNETNFSQLKGYQKVLPIVFAALAAFSAVCVFSGGSGFLGNGIGSLLRGLFSIGAYFIPFLLGIHALCYATDVNKGRLISRAFFSLTALLVSCMAEYAICFWGAEAVFAPAEFYGTESCGGFIGGVIGFVFMKMIGHIGVIVLGAAILAIYAILFYADRTGEFGQKATYIASKILGFLAKTEGEVKQKIADIKSEKAEREEEEHRSKSDELLNDSFFVTGGMDDLRIDELGIGGKPVEEPQPVEDTPPPRRRRNSQKPVDHEYVIEVSTDEPKAEKAETAESDSADTAFDAFGIDDNPEKVFTKNFDPFDFATGEKIATKPSSKATFEEEIDELTLLELKGEPTEREKRMMELEERKKRWLEHKKMQSARDGNAPAPQQSENSPVTAAASAPAATPISITENQPQSTSAPVNEPIVAPAPAGESRESFKEVNAYTSYASTQTTYTQPIKTVEFTFNSDAPATPSPSISDTESAHIPVIPESDDKSAEEAAAIIAAKIARANPAYARSANDMITYMKITPSPSEVNAESAQGTSASPEKDVIVEAPMANEAQKAEQTTDSFVNDANIPEEPSTPEFFPESNSATAEEDDFEILPPTEDTENPNDACADPMAMEAEAILELTSPTQAPASSATKTSYERAAFFASSIVTNDTESTTQSESAPEFKPYAPLASEESNSFPTVPDAVETLTVARSMVTPSVTVPEQIESQPSFNAEPDEAPSDILEESYTSDDESNEVDTSDAAPLFLDFNENDENDAEPAPIPSQSSEEIDWEADEELEESNTDNRASEIEFEENNDSDIVYEEDEAEEPVAESFDEIPEDDAAPIEEIPPEQQNPDVIKMREMFHCLAPIGEQTATNKDDAVPEAVVEEAPAPENSAPAISAPVISNPDNDEPPFDDAVIKETPAPVSVALVSKEQIEKEEKKAKKPDYSNYEFPPIELLAKEEAFTDENLQAEIQENADKLIETLASFGVTASIKGVDRGPRITRYEVVPAKGVKVSSILNLQDDIALNLAAGAIRMEAPIPGKSAVGIEIPNKKSSTVRLRDLLETEDFESSKSKTAVCIGRDVAGQPVFADIAKMPHLLIAGATGMGKSVCINSLMISMLYKARPDEVKFIMIDPKQVEFTMYNGIPHLLVPVVSDAKQAAGALMWAVEEMERRYNLLNPLCVRNVEAYNEKVMADPSLGEPMSKIVIVIDEFADLMLQVKDPVETLVMRIAQKARAAGIHLIIGTQRPSVNVITGVIKANVPSRISCKVMSNVDSKTVLDSAGAEKLLDRGDMLFAPAGSPKPHRVQGAFVADGEVEAIMAHLKKFSDGSNYDSNVMEEIERAAQKCSKKGGGGGSSDYDDGDDEVHGEGYLNDRQFLDAVEVAVNTRKISTSLIQRKLSIGYGKAAKFIDIMEDMGIVGEANGQRPREVLISPDEWREKLARATLD